MENKFSVETVDGWLFISIGTDSFENTSKIRIVILIKDVLEPINVHLIKPLKINAVI